MQESDFGTKVVGGCGFSPILEECFYFPGWCFFFEETILFFRGLFVFFRGSSFPSEDVGFRPFWRTASLSRRVVFRPFLSFWGVPNISRFFFLKDVTIFFRGSPLFFLGCKYFSRGDLITFSEAGYLGFWGMCFFSEVVVLLSGVVV